MAARVYLSRPVYTPPSVKRGSTRPITSPVPAEPVDPVAQVLASVEQLSEKDRALVLAKLALQMKDTFLDSRDERDLNLWVGAVCDEVARVTNTGQGRLKARQLLGTKAAWQPVKDQLQVLAPKEATAAQHAAILLFMARMLVEHADSVASFTGAPLTLKFVANCTAHVGALVERAFPGYASAGLLPFVVQKLTSAPKKV